MRAHNSTRRLLDFAVGRQILSNLCQHLPSNMGYRELQRKVQGADYWHINKVSFDHWILLLKKHNMIVNQGHPKGMKTNIQATDNCKMVFQHYADILRLPDLDTINREERRNRVLIFLNSLMPNYVNTSHLPWKMLKRYFPYLCYPPGDDASLEAVEDILGMPFLDFLCQRPFESNGIVFPSYAKYSSEEIKNLSNMLEKFNSNNNVNQTHHGIQIGDEVFSNSEDKLLSSYIERMGLYLLAQKFWEEYDLVFTFRIYDTLKDAFWDQEDWFRFIWYKSRFGTKDFSTIVNRYKIPYFRERLDNVYDEVFSEYKANVSELFKRTIRGKEYQNTRRKYSLFVNEMQDIVLPYVQNMKKEFEA